MRLLGPYPFDMLAPDRAGREMLARLGSAGVTAFDEGDGTEPGLYLIIDEDDALRGFWVSFSESWLDDGTGGGRVPPYAKALLDAATEEIWWERFAVAPKHLGAWRPIVVLEWPPYLADRARMAPPGIVAENEFPADEHTDSESLPVSGWLEPVQVTEDVPLPRPESAASTEWAGLPIRRSLVTLIRGSLRRTRAVHEGRFELVNLVPLDEEEGLGLASVPEEWRLALPLDEWVPQAAVGRRIIPQTHQLGHPLRLPGHRVAFPLSGWLTRDLDLAPGQPEDVAAGVLVSRDTRSQLFGQVLQSTSVTLALLIGILAFSLGMKTLAEPARETEAEIGQPAAQPALSVCSADYSQFVQAFRCHVEHLATGGVIGEADCSTGLTTVDLQADYCGLRDREPGPSVAPGFNWAELAASQACFEVLGRPYEYRHRSRAARSDRGPQIAETERLLASSRLSVAALVDLVGQLDATCSAYRDKLEYKVSGAVLAAHVGGSGEEAAALQDLVFRKAETGMSGKARVCFASGREDGPSSSDLLLGVCTDAENPMSDELDPSDAWLALGGEPPVDVPSALPRYSRARFRTNRPSQDLWECHWSLMHAGGESSLEGRWDLSVPVLGSYDDQGVSSQLALDAWLLALRGDEAVGDACWTEIDRMLASYVPVHPLLGPPVPDSWPSVEQQVCAAACAVGYRIARRPGDEWVTRGTDLSACLDASPIPDDAYEHLDGRLDRLRMPWSHTRNGAWTEPTAPQICAFNLLAQDLMPGVLPAEIAPPLWAGELASGLRVAGGVSGAAYRAADALSKYGRNRSTATCAYAAAQCLTAELLDVMADGRLGPQEWRPQWAARISQLTLARDSLADRPWCRLIRPYLSEDGLLPEGQLDLPCAMGVEDTRVRLEHVLAAVSSGSFTEHLQ